MQVNSQWNPSLKVKTVGFVLLVLANLCNGSEAERGAMSLAWIWRQSRPSFRSVESAPRSLLQVARRLRWILLRLPNTENHIRSTENDLDVALEFSYETRMLRWLFSTRLAFS